MKADDYNARLASGEIQPSFGKKVWWSVRGGRQEREKAWRTKDGRKEPSLVWAMNDSIKSWYWLGGLLGCFGETAQVLTPLLLKVRKYMRSLGVVHAC